MNVIKKSIFFAWLVYNCIIFVCLRLPFAAAAAAVVGGDYDENVVCN